MPHEMNIDESYRKGFAQLNNMMMDALYQSRMTPAETQIFWFIFRVVDGFNDENKEKHIPVRTFIKRTKIRRENIYRTLRGLHENKFINAERKEGVLVYSINHSYEQWRKAPGVTRIEPLKRSIGDDAESIRDDAESIRTDTACIKNDTSPVSDATQDVSGATQNVSGATQNVSERIHLLHTKGSTERSYTHISQRDDMKQKDDLTIQRGNSRANRSYTHISQRDESNQNDYSLDRMIQYAAQTCSLTIIGKNEATLKQLMKRHPDNRITEAMGNFALYQLEEMEGRRFPIGKTFDAFVRKFDLFADAESVDRRLADERRWFLEQTRPPGPEGLAVSSQANKDPEEDPVKTPEELQRRRIDFLRNFTGGIEAAASERGLDVYQMIKSDRLATSRYKQFKQELEELNELIKRAGGQEEARGHSPSPASLARCA